MKHKIDSVFLFIVFIGMLRAYKINLNKKYMYSKDENGKVHSINGQPSARYFNGTNALVWCTHGIVDRNIEEGPAFISNNECVYYVDGHVHNDPDHPAIITRYNTYYIIEYWTHGKFIKSVKVDAVLQPLRNYFSVEESRHPKTNKKHGICTYHHLTISVQKKYHNGLDLDVLYFLNDDNNQIINSKTGTVHDINDLKHHVEIINV